MLGSPESVRASCRRDVVLFTVCDAKAWEKTIRERCLGLFMLGVARNEIEIERLLDLADRLSQFHIENRDDTPKTDG